MFLLKDSIRKVEGENSVHIDRSNLYKVQTPQCFLSTDIKEAYTQEFSDTFTDDASVFEANGGKINTLLGEEKNLKITTKEDLKIAELFIQVILLSAKLFIKFTPGILPFSKVPNCSKPKASAPFLQAILKAYSYQNLNFLESLIIPLKLKVHY